jgi:hypothetical protein
VQLDIAGGEGRGPLLQRMRGEDMGKIVTVTTSVTSVPNSVTSVTQSPVYVPLHRRTVRSPSKPSVISVRPEWTYGSLCLLLLFISAYHYFIRLSVLLIPLLIPFLAFPLLFIISTNSVVSIYISSHLSRTLSFSLRILLLGES